MREIKTNKSLKYPCVRLYRFYFCVFKFLTHRLAYKHTFGYLDLDSHHSHTHTHHHAGIPPHQYSRFPGC